MSTMEPAGLFAPLFSKRLRVYTYGAIVITIIWVCFGLYNLKSFDGLFFLIAPPLFIFFTIIQRYLGAKDNSLLQQHWNQFATALELAVNHGGIDQQTGSIFRMTGDKKVSQSLIGTYAGHPMTVFLFRRFISTSNDSSVTYLYTVAEATLNGVLPALTIESMRDKPFDFSNPSNTLRLYANNTQEVTLEGGFNEHFDVYSQAGLEIPVRQILTPDIMALLIDNDQYSFEFTSNRVFIYRNVSLDSAEEVKAMTDLLVEVVDKLKTEVSGFQSDSRIHIVAAAQPTFTPNLSQRTSPFVKLFLLFWVLGIVLIPAGFILAVWIMLEYTKRHI